MVNTCKLIYTHPAIFINVTIRSTELAENIYHIVDSWNKIDSAVVIIIVAFFLIFFFSIQYYNYTCNCMHSYTFIHLFWASLRACTCEIEKVYDIYMWNVPSQMQAKIEFNPNLLTASSFGNGSYVSIYCLNTNTFDWCN